jgi:hypothetical protein
VVLFCTKNSSSEREAAAVHLVSASVDAKSQKRWRIVAGTNEVEEVLFALFDVDFVFFFVIVVPDAPPIIIIIYTTLSQRARRTTPTKARFLCASVVFSSVVSRLFSTRKKMSQRHQKSVARRFGSFLFAPRKSRSIIRVNPSTWATQKKSAEKQTNFFFAS